MPVEQFVRATEGRLVGTPPTGPIRSVSTDSRQIEPDCAFFAIKGQRFDGHDFVEEALRSGAAVAVVSRAELAQSLAGRGLCAILVDDTLAALGRLATHCRSSLGATVVAVTGSNGKTTTKQMLAELLSRLGSTLAAPKSYNNAIGVPLTILQASEQHEFLITELGTNAPGEIASLAAVVRPHVAVITAVAAAHLAGLGDIDGEAREKTSLLEYLPTGGLAVVNIDEPAIEPHLRRFEGSVELVRVGTSRHADLRAEQIGYEGEFLRFKVNGVWPVSLPIPGRHNALNALAAWAVAQRLGMPPQQIAEVLSQVRPAEMRLQRLRIADTEVINDAYNANPASVAAALRTLAELPASARRRVAILGDMLELGSSAREYHERIGRFLAELPQIRCLIAIGPLASGPLAAAAAASRPDLEIHRFEDIAQAARRIGEILQPQDLVLIKGSRAMQLERLLEAVRATRQQELNKSGPQRG